MTPVAPKPPVAKKVLVGFLAAVSAAILQKVAPGYHPDVLVQQGIDIAVGYGASFLVREELKYLIPATQAAKK
jgi:hypothetical protein